MSVVDAAQTNILNISVGADLSCPPPIYRPVLPYRQSAIPCPALIEATPKKPKLPILTLLTTTLILALQLILPTTAFASSIHVALNLPSDQAFARAEVSVVRLMVTYTPSSSTTTPGTPLPGTSSTQQANAPMICTGQGILVGSWGMNESVNGKSTLLYTNWVLTDSNLVNPTQPLCTTNLKQQYSLTNIDVLANNVYTNSKISQFTLGSLRCQGTSTSCQSGSFQNTFLPKFGTTPTNSTILFSFISSAPQPFVNMVTAKSTSQEQTPQEALWLTDANNHLPPSSLLSSTNLASNYLNPVSVVPGSTQTTTSTTPIPSPTNKAEPGTPTVNAKGDVVGIQSGSGPMPVEQVSTLLQQQPPQPVTMHTNPLQQAWDAGVAALFATTPDNKTATKDFAQATTANSAFHGGTALESSGNGQIQPTATPMPNPPEQVTTSSFNLSKFLLPIGAGVLVLLILFIMMGVLLRRRARQRELAQFEADRRAAELQVQRQQQPQPTPTVNKTSASRPTPIPEAPKVLIPVQPMPQPQASQTRQTELPAQPVSLVNEPETFTYAQTASDLQCPNCGRFARVGAAFCPNCRHQFAPAVPQAQAISVGGTTENAEIEARLRRLWHRSG